MVSLKIRWFEGLVIVLAVLCAAVFFVSYFRTNLSSEVIVTSDRGGAVQVTPTMPEEDVLLDLNRATLEELDALPYVSTNVAQRILNYRVKVGGFTSVEELLEVKGVSEELLNEIRAYVTVGEG